MKKKWGVKILAFAVLFLISAAAGYVHMSQDGVAAVQAVAKVRLNKKNVRMIQDRPRSCV